MGETFTLVLPLTAGKLKPGDTLVIKSIDGLSENFEYSSEPVNSESSSESIEVSALFVNTLENGQTSRLQQVIDRVNSIEHFCIKGKHENRNVKRGRKTKERSVMLEDVKEEWQRGELSARKAGEKLGVCHHTFLKWAKE